MAVYNYETNKNSFCSERTCPALYSGVFHATQKLKYFKSEL